MDGQAQRYGSPRIRIGPPRYRHVDSHLRSVDIQPGVMGNHSRVLGLHVCLMDIHAPGMDSHVPAVGNHATRMDGHTCTLDGHTHCLETHARLCGCPRHKGGRSRNSRGHPRHASSCLVWAWGWTAKTHALGNHNVWPRHRVGLPRNCGHLQLWASTRTSRCLVGVQVIGPGQTWGICGRPHAFSGHPTSGHPMRNGLARCRRGHEPARSLRCGRVDAMCCVRAWACVSTQAILRGRTCKDGKI